MFYGFVAITLIASYVTSQLIPTHSPQTLRQACEIFAIAATVTLVLLEWPHLARLTRNFCLLVTAILGVTLFLNPTASSSIWDAALRGSGFAAFLVAIGLIRIPLIKSKFIRRVSAGLLANSGRPNSLKSSLVAQFVALLFNVGAIRVIHDLSTDNATTGSSDASNERLRATTLHAMRNAAIMTLWSPIGVGFVIVTSGFPELNITHFFFLALVTGIALTLLTTTMGQTAPSQAGATEDIGRAPDQTRNAPTNVTASIILVLGFFALVASCVAISHYGEIPMIAATTLVITLVAVVWTALTKHWLGRGSETYFSIASDAAKSVANESGLFLSATLLSTILVSLITGNTTGLPGWLRDTMPILPVLAIAILIPLIAGAYVPHPLMIISSVQVLSASPSSEHHAYSLALALMLAWSLSICTSPISAMSMITGRLIGMTSSRVAHIANLKFEVFGLMIGVLFVCAAFALESILLP